MLLAAGSWIYVHGKDNIRYQTMPVERGSIQSSISATGACNAVVTVQVGSQVSGNVKALYADFNTKVKKGQLIAEIEAYLASLRALQRQPSRPLRVADDELPWAECLECGAKQG